MYLIVPNCNIPTEEATALENSIRELRGTQDPHLVTPYEWTIINLNGDAFLTGCILSIVIPDPTVPNEYLEEVYEVIGEHKDDEEFLYALTTPAVVSAIEC